MRFDSRDSQIIEQPIVSNSELLKDYRRKKKTYSQRDARRFVEWRLDNKRLRQHIEEVWNELEI